MSVSSLSLSTDSPCLSPVLQRDCHFCFVTVKPNRPLICIMWRKEVQHPPQREIPQIFFFLFFIYAIRWILTFDDSRNVRVFVTLCFFSGCQEETVSEWFTEAVCVDHFHFHSHFHFHFDCLSPAAVIGDGDQKKVPAARQVGLLSKGALCVQTSLFACLELKPGVA